MQPVKLEISTYSSRFTRRIGEWLRAPRRRRRTRFEHELLPPERERTLLPAFCFVCGARRDFTMDGDCSWMEDGVRQPNWRERLICPSCGLNCRMRAAIQLVEAMVPAGTQSAIYATEQASAFFACLRSRHPKAIGSEFLGAQVAGGTLDERGLRHENVEALSFADASFDLVISQDVAEHVAEPMRAFRELARVLKPGGSLLLTVPFDERRPTTVRRATRQADGKIVHHLDPVYHVDPLDPEGCLVFSDFGWDLLAMLSAAGFAACRVAVLWSADFAYLGPTNFFFVATRGAGRPLLATGWRARLGRSGQ